MVPAKNPAATKRRWSATTDFRPMTTIQTEHHNENIFRKERDVLPRKRKAQGNENKASTAPLQEETSSTTATTRRDLISSLSGISTAAAFTLFQSKTTINAHAMPALDLDHYNPSKFSSAPQAGRSYFPTITPPFSNRATYRYDLGREMYGFEQLLTFANVTATIRSIVVRMADGESLWVCSPQYPTGEFCQLLDELGGVVRHVVLPCNALEHKAPMKAFVQRYPKASVWITPGQYGPFGSCGMDLKDGKCQMDYKVDGILQKYDNAATSRPPWAEEFEYHTLYADLPQNAGPVSEAAFLHRPTKTLITTDAVVYIPDYDTVNGQFPSPIFETYFDAAEIKKDKAFWIKSVLQAVFLPLRRNDNGENEEDDNEANLWPGYNAIHNQLIRAPILRAFADARAPEEVREWVQSIAVSGGTFDRVVTSHFATPIRANNQDFYNAFGYLFRDTDEDGGTKVALPKIACQDWDLLEGLNAFIDDNQLASPVVFDYKSDCF